MKDAKNLMQRAHAAPRCSARAKSTGKPCNAPAVKGWRVCRMHGARGGHRTGSVHPAWRHGMRSKQWIEIRAAINSLIRTVRSSPNS